LVKTLSFLVQNLFFLQGRNNPLRAIMPVITHSVSTPEMEYTSYVRHCNPGKRFITAFSSSKGQKRLTTRGRSELTIIPDIYSEDEIHFFHGCKTKM
jgi:hypothetical protein